MSASTSAVPLASFTNFGDLLRYLRRRVRLTQRDLSIAVGYSESHISRLEQNQRPPDRAALMARFVPALELEDEPEVVARLYELAAEARGESVPAGGVSFARIVEHEIEEIDEPDSGTRQKLETIREYAREKLREAGEETSLRQRHLDYFFAKAQQPNPQMFGPDKGLWLASSRGRDRQPRRRPDLVDNNRSGLAAPTFCNESERSNEVPG